MPSPIAHAVAAYAVYRGCRHHGAGPGASRPFAVPRLLAATLVLSLLPDLPSVAAVFGGDLADYHNNREHSLAAGLAAAALLAGLARWAAGAPFRRSFPIVLLCYELHVIMDFFTVGRGVMLFWPLSAVRYSPPVKLFYGLHWSDGWLSLRHLWTLGTELAFALLVITGLAMLRARRPRPGRERGA